MSLHRRLFLTGTLVLLACCAALAILPARWIMAAIPDHWPLAVVDANGTLWSGSATLALGAREHQRTLPAPLRWNTSWSQGPKLTATHPWLNGPVTFKPVWSGLSISGQSMQLPASALATLDARIAAIGPAGTLSIKWPATIVGTAARPAGTSLLKAQWVDAASALTFIRPLGSYTLLLSQAASGLIDVTLSTQQGPLILRGKGMLDSNKGLQFDGTAQADQAASDDIHAALQDVLAALGPQRNNLTLLRVR
ncbi:type II secretion system protein N [Pollutimonas harenae]|uniref:Type II secretion system protein N n=1 Tax=Pollutimonas harenae TaxID=657015 RepID=A0A853GZ72_9BURK|nr:type II secretion system protein N [Pollutimonas harenae]NYT86006.1 type II secretion system protein N [Pollutimonas harenae]TEA71054.1 general secretion pathway protein GspN [Pollutimonas harenae]